MPLSQSYLAATRRANIPTSAQIELLSPCNLKCPHCYVTHHKASVLTLDILKTFFADFASHGGFSLNFTGGEIALRKDLYDIIAAARSHALDITLHSSGTLWDERDWQKLAELGVRQVQLSLYAMEAEIHDAVTLQSGSHAKTMASIDGLRAQNIEVVLACPVLEKNAPAVTNVLQYGKALKMPVRIDPLIMRSDQGHAAPQTQAANFEQIKSVFFDPLVSLGTPDAACATASPDERSCAVGEKSFFVNSSADVFPCTRWPKAGGNLGEQSFIDIWRHSETFRFARKLTYEDLSSCHSCGDRIHCENCMAMHLKDTGSLQNPSASVCMSAEAKNLLLRGASSQPYSSRTKSLPIVA